RRIDLAVALRLRPDYMRQDQHRAQTRFPLFPGHRDDRLPRRRVVNLPDDVALPLAQPYRLADVGPLGHDKVLLRKADDPLRAEFAHPTPLNRSAACPPIRTSRWPSGAFSPAFAAWRSTAYCTPSRNCRANVAAAVHCLPHCVT